MSGNWLPEVVTLKLTALEAGALAGILHSAKRDGQGEFMVNKPGPNGEPVPISMTDRLCEKLSAEIEQFYK
jgi:hypothetical protein